MRTRETMEILRAGDRSRIRPPTGLDPRLVELTFGAWEGLTWKEVRRADPQRAAARERDKWGYVPPGGRELRHAGGAGPPGPRRASTRETVVVSHGGVARAFLALAGGVPERSAAAVDIWQGKVLVIAGGRYEWV